MPNTPLNPDALEVASNAVRRIALGEVNSWDVSEAAITAYLAFAQPEVSSLEELDQLPVESVVRDSAGLVYENDPFDQKQDYKWARMASGGNYPTRAIDLPARVLYRPTKEATNGR